MAHAGFCDKLHQLPNKGAKESGIIPTQSLDNAPRWCLLREDSDNDTSEDEIEFECDVYDLPDVCVGIYYEVGDHDSSMWSSHVNMDDDKHAITDIFGV